MIGTSLSHFKITAKLGQGGMGEVYRAEDTKLGRDVAIKVLPESVARDPERLARFDREAKLLAALDHPNIASIYSLETAKAGTGAGHYTDGAKAGTEAPPPEAGTEAPPPEAGTEAPPPEAGTEAGHYKVAGETVTFLVMQLAEGEDLQKRLSGGSISVDEALPIGLQVAQAIEAAHEKGIIHRDLKPANVIVDEDGQVKVLDFGLAKALDPNSVAGSGQNLDHSPLSLSPTLTDQMTGAGVILGTAAYMSPEQAKGKKVDSRADIWAFGILLFEMLSGQRVFRGETASETLATVMLKDPDWSLIPGNTPPRAKELLERCLVKDPKERLRDIGDARIELGRMIQGEHSKTQTPQAPPGPSEVSTSKSFAMPVLAGLALGALLGTVGMWFSRGADTSSTPSAVANRARLSIALPANLEIQGPEISPDGKTVAMYGSAKAGSSSDEIRTGIYLRTLDDFELRFLEGAEGGIRGFDFSPDGSWVAFVSPTEPGSPKWQLLKAPLDGSRPPVALTDWSDEWINGIEWLPTDEIIFLQDSSPPVVLKVPANGGKPEKVSDLDLGDVKGRYTLTNSLPDKKHVLMLGEEWDGGYSQNVGLLDLATGETRVLIDGGSRARWSPTGHLLFTRNDTLLAAPFNLDTLEVGGAVAVMGGLRTDNIWAPAVFDYSTDGTLVFKPGGVMGSARRIAIVDREGGIEFWGDERKAFEYQLSVPRSGDRFAIVITNLNGLYEIWGSEFDSPRLTRLASNPDADCQNIVLSDDGQYLVYNVRNPAKPVKIVGQRFDGTDPPTELFVAEGEHANTDFFRPSSISPDGSLLLITRLRQGEPHIVAMDLTQDKESGVQPRELIEKAWAPFFTPDGRWIVYGSSTSGRNEIYLRRLDAGGSLGPAIPVTTDGISWLDDPPRGPVSGPWEIVMGHQEKIYSITIRTDPELRISKPIEIPAFSALWHQTVSIDVLPDGRALVALRGEDEVDLTSISLIQGFDEELKRLVPTN